MNKNVAVNIFLYDPDRRSVLLQLRDNNPAIANPNVWCLPGGGAEPEDGSPEEAALRELLEETGYHAPSLRMMGSDGEFGLERYFFAVPYDGKQTIIRGEGQRLEFVPLDNLPTNVWEGHTKWILIIGRALGLIA